MDGKRRKQSIGFPVLLEMMFPRRLMEKIKEQLKIDGSKGVQAEHNYMREGTHKRYESSKYRDVYKRQEGLVKNIQEVLDEKEREEFTRLKVIKKQKDGKKNASE